MTQNAVVTKVLPNSMAEVVVTRSSACGSNCGSCESCIFQSELKAIAKNSIHAKPGQHVIISSRSKAVFSAAVLVYIMPLVFVIAGFTIATLLGAGEGISILSAFLCLIISAVLLVVFQKKNGSGKQIEFEIVS